MNFTGQLFRKYPEAFQVLLSTGDGKSRQVATTPDRPTNQYFRDALTDGLKIPGVSKDEMKQKGNLVWWEKEEAKETSSKWRK